jgi:glycosyltransferase involved in cell wall biosynthesis
MPFFSIIIPAYNLEKYINRAISSILNQSFKDFEIIIINDGSTDKTANIINGYAKETEKIKIITHLKNESQHAARMDGVAVSTGQYILFLDGDDYFTDNAFTSLYNLINKNPNYNFYEFGYIKQPSGEIILPLHTNNNNKRFYDYFNLNNYPRHTMWNKVYETNLLKKAFSLMEKTYLNHTEDLYESIIIAYFSENIFITNIIVTNYSESVGISNIFDNYNSIVMCLASSKYSLDKIQIFLNNINIKIDITELKNRIINYILKNDNYKHDEQEFNKKLLKKFFEIFDNETILDYWLYQEKKLKEYKDIVYSHKDITYSIDHKLGRIILFPLRKLIKLFKRKK